ncbi:MULTISPECIES: aminodeoxychorismate synthase component I [Rhodobacterales]|uniref:Aminodeoxychorismate synthase component I n=2 Tax=Rhodobacterales TaxID=204455 RepID=A0A917AG75_9RHOB|nr:MULTISPECIES: aminodeoxychorismate synthase component I [Rhodobacterales]MWB79707.1 aminodeoxychorismate synthase component I [Pseudooceanicola pacificus]GGE48223.1 aminodeoxychorismate synthase component I [Primorskyibacter flagellatus]
MDRPEAAYRADGPSILLRDDLAGTEMRFATPREVIRADHLDEVQAALDRMERTRAAGKWCAGYVSYEAGYALEPKLRDIMPGGRRLPLVLIGVFNAPETGSVGTRATGKATLTDVRPEWAFENYRSRFERVHRHLRTGDCYQANLTFPFSARWSGDPIALFEEMTARQPVRYAALVDLGGPIILSRSPELFFQVDAEDWIETHPMKGTIRRGSTPEADAALAETLRQDGKNQAENLMIVDLLRNDISRICQLGTLHVPELFRIESYPTVHQMVSRVRARLALGTTVSDTFTALFPCGSITGAPKIRAMQILRALESRPRDIYCGAIGFIAPSGEMRFNVAIRTLTLHAGGEAVFNVGGGIVFDSEVRSEYDECLLKARFASGPDSKTCPRTDI